eukprot:6439577-Lingulodinium_polyedra.AAC.1
MRGVAIPRAACSLHLLATGSANPGSISAKWLAVRAPGALDIRRRSSRPTRAIPAPSKSNRS